MECIGKVIEGEVSQSTRSVFQSIESKMRDGTKVEETPPREPSKVERSANLPPGSTSGKDNRRLGGRGQN